MEKDEEDEDQRVNKVLGVVEKTYANALFELLLEEDSLDSGHRQYQAVINQINHNQELAELFHNQKASKKEKSKALKKAFLGLDESLLNFLLLLTSNDRVDLIFKVYEVFCHLYNDYHGISIALIRSPLELNEELLEQIVKLIRNKLQRRIEAEVIIDNSLNNEISCRVEDKALPLALLKEIQKLIDADKKKDGKKDAS